ncbi:MAG TPA: hypothetical protein VEL74_01200 [Thermoanaerobaculia bacterium]|nr:hypothetical protein [Thermoanaerobaculia bacterium]
MRPSRVVFAALFTFAAWAASASASTYANFSGNCIRFDSSSPAYCVFDGNRTYDNGHTSDTTATTCGNASVSAVYWDFGDGTGTWDDLYVGHTYSDPAAIDNDAIITMTLFCSDNTWDEKVRYLLFVLIGPGDMYCNEGWN